MCVHVVVGVLNFRNGKISLYSQFENKISLTGQRCGIKCQYYKNCFFLDLSSRTESPIPGHFVVVDFIIAVQSSDFFSVFFFLASVSINLLSLLVVLIFHSNYNRIFFLFWLLPCIQTYKHTHTKHKTQTIIYILYIR